MTIHEPATLLTDYLLAALAGWLSWRLRGRRSPENRAQVWWSRMLALTCASALVGGSYHGFGPEFPPAIQRMTWIATLWIIVALAAALEISLIHELVPAARRVRWLVVVTLKFALFLTLAAARPVFATAIAAYGVSLLAWIVAAVTTRRPWRGWILGGIALSILAALTQQLRWAPSAWFNHNDLYHVVQAIALFAFYRAGVRFRGR